MNTSHIKDTERPSGKSISTSDIAYIVLNVVYLMIFWHGVYSWTFQHANTEASLLVGYLFAEVTSQFLLQWKNIAIAKLWYRAATFTIRVCLMLLFTFVSSA